MRVRRGLVVGGLVFALLAVGAAASAATGDDWLAQGAKITRAGFAASTTSYGSNQVVYTGTRVTFPMYDMTVSPTVSPYTLVVTGTMINSGYEWFNNDPTSGQFSFTAFNFYGRPVLKAATGTTVCSGGVFTWGGQAYNGLAFGQFKFPTTCKAFTGWQYFNTYGEAGGGGVPITINMYLVQR
jgi:hypothetical protein